ncbi:unnamed protein product, partial [Polarella glacialis]
HFVSGPTRTADVIVVGSGVIGTSVALSLGRRGKKVLVVDRHRGAGQGSTSYSSGICRMHYSILDSVKFSWEGYHYWKHWKDHIGVHDERGYARLRECGSLIFKTKASLPFINKIAPLWDE